MLLTLTFTCLALFGLPWTEQAIQTAVYGSYFCGNLPQSSFTLSASLRESCRLASQRGA
jgi:hypothetical protein